MRQRCHWHDSMAIKQVDPNTFTGKAKNSKTKYQSSVRTVVSHDGKTMTTMGEGTDADGKAMTRDAVPREAVEPFAIRKLFPGR